MNFLPLFHSAAQPYWRGPEHTGDPIADRLARGLSEELKAEGVIWRAILSERVTLGEVARGDVTLDQLLRLNAWLDYQQAVEREHMDKAKAKQR